MICDLHCHTTMSDGSLGIEDVILQAKRMNIDFLSITDHDTLSSFSRAKILGERYGVKMIQGVEMSAWDKERNRKVHIICYAPKKPDRLEGLCLKSCEIRKSCSKEMIEKVMQLYPITPESVLKHCTGSKSIYKSHIMRALIEYGYACLLYTSSRYRIFAFQHILHSTGKDYISTVYTGARTNIYYMIRGKHCIVVMLDDDKGIAEISQTF